MNHMTLLEMFDEFADTKRQSFLHVKEIKDNGGSVAGIFCAFVPVEILDAAKISVVSLSGMSEETIADAEATLPKNLSPFIKSSYGFAVYQNVPLFISQILSLVKQLAMAKRKCMNFWAK